MGEKPNEEDEAEARKSASVILHDRTRQRTASGPDTPEPPVPAEASSVKSSKSNTSD